MKEPRSRVKGRTRGTSAIRPLHLTTESSTAIHPVNPPISLLSDFGDGDYFVGAMKGTILSINPEARVVDISHSIQPQDIEAAAFTLLAGYQSFPAGAIHVAVVDPGVGSGRRPILVQAGNYFFVGPDNGIFSYIFDREADFTVFHLTNEQYFRQPVSATFHGRDIFAPVAAVLSLGISPRKLGKEIGDPIRLQALQPERLKSGRLRGRVIHIDRFGNCITNIRRDDFTAPATLEIGKKTIKSFKRFFADEGKDTDEGKDKLFGVWGSAGFLELAANNASAAKLLRAKRGQPVFLSSKP
ncbi:MAG TPA: SAM-dependent chlorinase/fluorinase [Pyrinomonadaceae bacterium]|nr:SAM-dependent chlorinase/fluorinase [Pyrinomonadaceae bacterium]